jgi:hypothetical protein
MRAAIAPDMLETRSIWKTVAAAVLVAAAGVVALADEPPAEPAKLDALIEGWPEPSRKAARATIEQYGEPEEVTPRRLIWHNAGPWKRVTVHAEDLAHDFPRPHADVIETVIDYKVPVDKIDDLARFDGSLTVARTAGELAVRCEDERMGYLAMNLAHEVATGAREVAAAREAYRDAVVVLLKKKEEPPEITRKLQFAVGEVTADRDVVMKLKMSK